MIYIYSPSNSVTGGVESLHQLSNALIKGGFETEIIYYPERDGGRTIKHFHHYQRVIFEGDTTEIDKEENILVVPEVATYYLRNFQNLKKAIFWLSIDNYFPRKRESAWTDFYKNLKATIRGSRLSFREMKGLIHLAQSHYSELFLASKSFKSHYIGDYIHSGFFDQIDSKAEKRDVVAYNPKKGKRYFEEFKRVNPDLEFIPLINMSREEMINNLNSAKVYIDFGQHPGRDRIPREAAILGCCIITSTFGSAENPKDVLISDEFKFNMNKGQFKEVGAQIRSIFADYEGQHKHFEAYLKKLETDEESHQASTEKAFQELTQ